MTQVTFSHHSRREARTQYSQGLGTTFKEPTCPSQTPFPKGSTASSNNTPLHTSDGQIVAIAQYTRKEKGVPIETGASYSFQLSVTSGLLWLARSHLLKGPHPPKQCFQLGRKLSKHDPVEDI